MSDFRCVVVDLMLTPISLLQKLLADGSLGEGAAKKIGRTSRLSCCFPFAAFLIPPFLLTGLSVRELGELHRRFLEKLADFFLFLFQSKFVWS